MPKETFLRLDESKKARFIAAALEEFAHNSYEQASITQLVKKLGIAKGSVYQYFEDKTDLWLYLKKYSEEIKLGYIQRLRREDYPDFWSYYRAMYAHGVYFDLEAPLCSLFLYRIGKMETSNAVAHFLQDWQAQALVFFGQWIAAEQSRQTFRQDIPIPTLAHFMVSMSMSIADLLRYKYKVDFEANIASGRPVFAQQEAELMQAVDELILLMRGAVSPPKE
jgi:AcrR family transcriptional regulator